tara:strand:+ start:3983 stop:4201 length:219 start_codon:yes stop_codon:yes gene_type:complete
MIIADMTFDAGTRYINLTSNEVRVISEACIGQSLGGESLPDAVWFWVDGVPSYLPFQTSPAEFAAWADEVAL